MVRSMPRTASASEDDARFIFEQWDRRARTRDTPGLLELYTDDAVLETPLAPRILHQPSGVLRGKDELRCFFEEGGRRRPNEKVRWHRDGTYLWDGHTLFWEYLRAAPVGTRSTSPRSCSCAAARSPFTGSTEAGSAPRC